MADTKIILHDKDKTDGSAYEMVRRIKTDLPILLISRVSDYKFNEEILQLAGKPYVLICFCEYGWDKELKETHIWGKNTDKFLDIFGSEEWEKLDHFVRGNPPVITMKRELLRKDASPKIQPIEYANLQPQYPMQSMEEFNTRPISSYLYWGRSHEARLMYQGEMWKNAARKGYAVCDNVYFFNAFMQDEINNPNKWVTFNMPHYARIPLDQLLLINGLSKLSVSLFGCGRKCFRSTGESIVNSVAVMPEDDLAYSYEFIDGINCIKFPIEDITGLKKEWPVIETIEKALKNKELYSIYLGSLKAADFYRIDNYTPYLESIINNA